MKYRFLDFELDADRFELRQNGKKVVIQPQALTILRILLELPNVLISKQAIFFQVWGVQTVSESALSSQIKILRRILGDDGQQQQVIQTIYGRGFRFAATVETETAPVISLPSPPRPQVQTAPAERTGKAPVIAVLPFSKLGQQARQSGLSEALPAEITTALSQLRWLFVIARASSFRFGANLPDLAKMREELRADYVLTGWVEILNDHMLVGVELTETRHHRVVWAQRYDAPLSRIHELRAQMVRDIIGAIDISISDAEAALAKLAAPDELTAWESYHLGMSAVNSVNMDLKAALAHFELARKTAPTFSRGHAGAAYSNGLGLYHLAQGGNENAAIDRMQQAGEQALQCDPLDPFAHLVKGRAERFSGNMVGALDHYSKAIALCPNYAEAYHSQAVVLLLNGDFSAAYAAADRAIRLSPHCPMRFEAETTQAYAAFKLGNNEEALALSRKITRFSQNSPLPLLAAITVFHHLGREQEARLTRSLLLANGMRPRIDMLQTFPESAAEMSSEIAQTVAHYFNETAA